MVLVTYHGKNLLTVHITSHNSVTFVPGINELTDQQLEDVKKHPLMQTRLESGKIVVMPEGKLGTDGKRSVKDMLAYIPQIFDSKLIRKIIDTDGREQVVRAAQDRLDVLKGKKEDVSDQHFR
jgi:hypothetical protein